MFKLGFVLILAVGLNAHADLPTACKAKAESLAKTAFLGDFSDPILKISSDEGQSFHAPGESYQLKAWYFTVKIDAGYAYPSTYKVSLQERGDEKCILRALDTDFTLPSKAGQL